MVTSSVICWLVYLQQENFVNSKKMIKIVKNDYKNHDIFEQIFIELPSCSTK